MVNWKDKPSNIGLIGFMATGKTSIGSELSKRLDRKFIDIDHLIEERTGMTIWDIFREYGEDYFRKIEKETIEEVSRMDNMIISYGGGACLEVENIANIRRNSLTILLETDPQIVRQRLANDRSRPLLEEGKSIEEIKKLMASRKEAYHKASDFIIDTGNKSISNIGDEIIKVLGSGLID